MKLHTHRQSKSRFAVRLFVTFSVLVGLLTVGLPIRFGQPVMVEARAAADLPLRSESQLRSEASLYQTAINEIGRISTMSLTTVKELAVANAVVEKHVSNLRFARSKLIALGLNDSSFVSAVKAKGRDKEATVQFGTDLVKDRSSIFRVSGGQALGDRMRSSLNADVAKIRQIAAQLKKAAADVKGKQGHHFSRSGITPSSAIVTEHTMLSMPSVDIDPVLLAVLVIVVAVIVCPPLGLVLLNLAGVATVPVFVAIEIAGAAQFVASLVENAGTDEGRDKVAACQDAVDRKYRRCKDNAEDKGLLAEAYKAECYAEWLTASAACWVS